MALPGHDERYRRWRERRSAWLQAKAPWVHEYPYPDTDVSTVAATYVRDEILVSEAHQADGLNIVSGLGHRRSAIETRDVVPGFRMLKTSGLDAWTATRRLRDNLGRTPGAVVSLNHVYMSSPLDQGGPHGEPSPGQPVDLHAPGTYGVKVAVLDTGVWSDSPLPASAYTAGPGDFETEMDINADGLDRLRRRACQLHRRRRAPPHRPTRRSASSSCSRRSACAPTSNWPTRLLALDDVDVVNLSLGTFTVDDQPSPVVQLALETVLAGKDRIVVAAAGNDGQAGRPFWPAAFSTAGHAWSDQVLAVAAHDGNGVCTWSNTGPWVTLAAPGQDVPSTYIVHGPDFATGWATWSGTSFAAPYVVAAIADQLAACGTVTAAADQVRKNASQQTLRHRARVAMIGGGCGGHQSGAPAALLTSRTVADFEPAAALALAAGGDQLAWDSIVSAYGEMVWGIARSYRLSSSDAADVVQATWLKLVEHVGDIREGDRLGAWLATTTRREALGLLRRSKRDIPVEDAGLAEADDREARRPRAAGHAQRRRPHRCGRRSAGSTGLASVCCACSCSTPHRHMSRSPPCWTCRSAASDRPVRGACPPCAVS